MVRDTGQRLHTCGFYSLIHRNYIQQSTTFENEFIAKGVEWYMICDMIIYEVCLRRIGDLGHNNSIYKHKRRTIYYIYVYR